jgi:uridine phosphorylase
MNKTSIRRALAHTALAALLASHLATARAQSELSALSALSALPIAVSVTPPVMVLSAGAVEASATGAVWVLERASDGARASVRLGAQAAGGLSVAAGTALVVTAMSTGWVLSAASQAIAFIPNEIGSALLYNERVTR